MSSIQILAFSPKSGFKKSLKKAFPASSIQQFDSLADHPKSKLNEMDLVGFIDLDAYQETRDDLIQIAENLYPGIDFIFVSDEQVSNPSLSPDGYYQISLEILSSSLGESFIRILLEKSFLIKVNKKVEENLNKRLNELLLIRKASLHLTMNLSLDAVLESILDSAMELVSANDTHVFLYEGGVLSFAAAIFDGHQQREPFMNPRPHGMTYTVAREGSKIIVNNTLKNSLFDDMGWEGSIIGLPLKIGNTVRGVMNVALLRPHAFTENEIRVLEFLADQAAIAIQNAKLYEQAQQEIADRKKAEEAIKHLAHHDALTGLPNRRLFNERINLEIARSERNNQRIGVMLFDLDQLKKVNDTYGHTVGDLLLQAVAQRLLGLLRKSDTVARMGGDEFLLILPEMEQPDDAVKTAERVLSALSTPFNLEGHHINITTSIGISFFPDDGKEVDELVRKADLAMYKAKDKGGNIFHIFTS